MSKLNKLSNTNKLILVSLFLILLTNPWSVGFIGSGIDTAVVYFTLYANYVFVGGLALLGLVNVYMMWLSRGQVSVPKTKKSAKHGMKYEVTN